MHGLTGTAVFAAPLARRSHHWMLAGALAALPLFAAAQTCVAPTVLHPDGGSISGDTCIDGESSVVLCGTGKSGRAVIYSIDAEHLSGWIDGATTGFSMFLAVKNSNCLTGDCISTQPGSPILFTPDMTGPFLVVVTGNPHVDTGAACGAYTLFPNLRVIDDLLLADGFDRPVVTSAELRN